MEDIWMHSIADKSRFPQQAVPSFPFLSPQLSRRPGSPFEELAHDPGRPYASSNSMQLGNYKNQRRFPHRWANRVHGSLIVFSK
jgi:hypothetical protein